MSGSFTALKFKITLSLSYAITSCPFDRLGPSLSVESEPLRLYRLASSSCTGYWPVHCSTPLQVGSSTGSKCGCLGRLPARILAWLLPRSAPWPIANSAPWLVGLSVCHSTLVRAWFGRLTRLDHFLARLLRWFLYFLTRLLTLFVPSTVGRWLDCFSISSLHLWLGLRTGGWRLDITVPPPSPLSPFYTHVILSVSLFSLRMAPSFLIFCCAVFFTP